jgi:hypothetical protein
VSGRRGRAVAAPAAPRRLPALVEDARDLGRQAVGRQAQLDERIGLQQPRVGQLVGERSGVAERVDRVAPVAVTRVGASIARRSCGPGAARPKNSPCITALLEPGS